MNDPEDILKKELRPLAEAIARRERDDSEAGKELAEVFLRLDDLLKRGARIPVDWPGDGL